MKIFGISVVTIVLVVLAYFVGSKYSSFGTTVLGKVGL